MISSKQEAIDLIKMIHFQDSGKTELLKDSWKKWKDKNGTLEFPIISDHNVFLNRLQVYLTEDVKNKIVDFMSEDSKLFKTVINLFDELRARSDLPINSLDKVSITNNIDEIDILKKIEKFGVAKHEGLFSESDLSTLINFQDVVYDSLNDKMNHSGYISMNRSVNRSGEKSFQVRHDKTKENHGLTRLQSKSMGFFHPGSDILINNPYLGMIFKSYYRNLETEFHRATMEWVSPAPYNHNGWHCDLIRNQLKVQILLDDVNFENAPMFYAVGSNRISNSFELKIKHSLFNYGLDKKICLGKMWKKHEATITPCHVGYLSDEVVDNVPAEINEDPIQIGDFTYDKFVCTGKRGDCIFFESSGFHSGNIARNGVRKDIILTCPDRFPFKNKFLEYIGKSNC